MEEHNKRSELFKSINQTLKTLLPENNDSPIYHYFAKFFMRLDPDEFTKKALEYKKMLDKYISAPAELLEKDDLYQYAKSLEPTKVEQDAFDEFHEKLRKLTFLSKELMDQFALQGNNQ
ncbi:MAG TPA: hypothetical protein VG982_00520 [Candidatus Paceibacterota bacterium]|nr:hypothetical protein [Candidatus Paceibacterota bacterium]